MGQFEEGRQVAGKIILNKTPISSTSAGACDVAGSVSKISDSVSADGVMLCESCYVLSKVIFKRVSRVERRHVQKHKLLFYQQILVSEALNSVWWEKFFF